MKAENFLVSVKRPSPLAVHTPKRFYVCLLMDGFTHMISGGQVSRHPTQPLTLKSLQQVLRQSVPEIHHSEQDIQYLSQVSYISMLKQYGNLEISVARSRCPWENGSAKRRIRTLKAEEVHLNDDEDITEARQHIGQFIRQVYHQKRPHSALGYLTPDFVTN